MDNQDDRLFHGAVTDSEIDTIARVAAVVSHSGPGFVSTLQDASPHFDRPGFEAELAVYLRGNPGLIDEWSRWSGDQRWTPSAYLEGTEVGWYESGYTNVRHHADRADAAADFIHRMAVWLAERRIIVVDEKP